MFEKGLRKSIEPYLEPGEEPLTLIFAQAKGTGAAMFSRAVMGNATAMSAESRSQQQHAAASEAAGSVDVKLDKKMAVAITSRRLLIFKAGGAMTVKAQQLLTANPVADVDAIEIGKATLTKPITITVRGASFTIETPKAAPADDLRKALAQAKGMAAV